MQSHLCPAMDPILVQPHITRPLPPASSALGVCPNQTPTLLFTQLTTCSSPLWTLPTPHPPPRPIKEAAPGPQTGLLLLPPSAFPARPHTHSVSSCAGSVGLLSHPHLSVHTGPSVQSQGAVHRTQKEGGRRDLPFPPSPPGGALPFVFPQPSVGALDDL